MTPNRLTLVTLGVADLAAAKAFYGRLGMVPMESPPGVAFFDFGPVRFGLFPLDALAAEQGRGAAGLGRGAMTLSVNWETADAVDAAFEIALDAGATALAAPHAMGWGGHSGCWADPDGHVWEYAWNPFWPLDPDGRLAPS